MMHLSQLQQFGQGLFLEKDQFYLRVAAVVALAYFLYRGIQRQRALSVSILPGL